MYFRISVPLHMLVPLPGLSFSSFAVIFHNTTQTFSENTPQFSEEELISLCSQILTLSSHPPPFHSVMWLAAAKSLQSYPTLCDPRDGSPPGSPIPGILQARTLEWVAISFSNAWKWKVKVKSLSRVQLLATPWTTASQAPPSMGFSRQEYWSGVPASDISEGRNHVFFSLCFPHLLSWPSVNTVWTHVA